jgi:hypothetical protein
MPAFGVDFNTYTFTSAPLRIPSPNFAHIHDVYDLLGPTPRLCFEVDTAYELELRYRATGGVLSTLTVERFEKLGTASGALTMDADSQRLCLIRRAGPTTIIERANLATISVLVQISPITDSIASQITANFRNLERRAQVRLYRKFSSLPSARGMAGSLFKAYCQQLFDKHVSLKFIPMVRLPDPQPTMKRKRTGGTADGDRRRPQWHSGHSVLGDRNLEQLRQAALPKEMHLDIHPSATCEYVDSDTLRVLPDTYYIPRATNQVALDSFLLCGPHLYIFQFAGGKKHGVNEKFLPFLAKCTGLPSSNNWRFIFVIADDVETMKCPVPHNTGLQKLDWFSSIVVLEG